MKKYLLLALSVLFSASFTSAQERTDKHAEVKAAIEAYWNARNAKDHNTVWNLESRSGTLGTNSDGSFHKPLEISTPDEWKKNMAAGRVFAVQIFALQIADLSAEIVYARYYLEGIFGPMESPKPYRTRCTSVWIKEEGQWRLKAGHFSSASFGGTYTPDIRDFVK